MANEINNDKSKIFINKNNELMFAWDHKGLTCVAILVILLTMNWIQKEIGHLVFTKDSSFT
jgi:hypothetical protein